jgi:hypothetical protein
MIVKLSKPEHKTLSALDPKGKGNRPWQTARELAGVVFRKKPENANQDEIRAVRNALRKPLRENLVEMNPAARGQYRINERGRKLMASGLVEFTGQFDRGDATTAAKAAGQARMKARPKTKKASAKKATTKKASAKKAPKKKAPTKRTAKKATAKKAPKKAAKAAKKAPKKATAKAPTKKAAKAVAKPKVVVEDKTKDGSKDAKAASGNGESSRPKFKRRQALTVANHQSSAEK